MTAPTHYALVHEVDNTAEIIAAGDADFCDRELHAWLDVHPLTDTQTAEVVAREMTYAQGGIIPPGTGPTLETGYVISRAQLDKLGEAAVRRVLDRLNRRSDDDGEREP